MLIQALEVMNEVEVYVAADVDVHALLPIIKFKFMLILSLFFSMSSFVRQDVDVPLDFIVVKPYYVLDDLRRILLFFERGYSGCGRERYS